MQSQASDHITTLSALAASAPITRVEQTDVRMFHVDATRRLKLRALLQVTYPMVFDTWRERFDMSGMIARAGIWPFSSYIEIEASAHPLAAAKPGRFSSALECGQIPEGRRGAGALLMATQVTLRAQTSGGHALDFTDASGDEYGVVAGRMQVFGSLIRPQAPAEQRMVTSLPEQMSTLRVTPCEPVPTSVDPGPPSAAQRSFESRESQPRVLWSLQHTDANLSVLGAEYLVRAEDYGSLLAREAGLAFAKFRPERARMALKRGFSAGQEAVLRGRLLIEADEQRFSAFVTFHARDAAGSIDERPAIEVCVDFSAVG